MLLKGHFTSEHEFQAFMDDNPRLLIVKAEIKKGILDNSISAELIPESEEQHIDKYLTDRKTRESNTETVITDLAIAYLHLLTLMYDKQKQDNHLNLKLNQNTLHLYLSCYNAWRDALQHHTLTSVQQHAFTEIKNRNLYWNYDATDITSNSELKNRAKKIITNPLLAYSSYPYR